MTAVSSRIELGQRSRQSRTDRRQVAPHALESTARAFHRHMAGQPQTQSPSEQTTQRILSVAQTQFAAEGYEGTTIRGVAEQAGIDPSMVMRYFGSKQGCLQPRPHSTCIGPILLRAHATERKTTGATLPQALGTRARRQRFGDPTAHGNERRCHRPPFENLSKASATSCGCRCAGCGRCQGSERSPVSALKIRRRSIALKGC